MSTQTILHRQPCWRSGQRPRRATALRTRATGSQARVSQLVQDGASLYSTGAEGAELAAAVAEFIASNDCRRPGPQSLSQGQGSWEVFHAPHIARLSAELGARFQPIRYTLRGREIISNVRYQHPLLGTGWLSASGTISAADDTTLLLHFDRFWWDRGDAALRTELGRGVDGTAAAAGEGGSSGGSGVGPTSWLDAVVSALGRAGFIPPLARFPVEALDGPNGLSVFRFPPLASNIAIMRCGSEGLQQRS